MLMDVLVSLDLFMVWLFVLGGFFVILIFYYGFEVMFFIICYIGLFNLWLDFLNLLYVYNFVFIIIDYE